MKWLRYIFPADRRQLRNFGIRWIAIAVAVAIALAITYPMFIGMPGKSWRGALPELSGDQRSLGERLRAHVEQLAGKIGRRNNWNKPEGLEAAAQYIEAQFAEYGYAPQPQPFPCQGRTVRNIVAERRGASRAGEIVVIGAHYDSAEQSPAANDNGSGVAALLELARRFSQTSPSLTLRFVAFVNEEPPYFQTELMGSLVYAKACKARGYKIAAMMSLETMGYYDDRKGSQHYPPPFSYFYPNQGNFIGFVGDAGSGDLVRRCVGAFRRLGKFPSEGVAAPRAIAGIGWSDHWSFWQAGYPALMVTDTAPFRYPFYHQTQDTPDKLDYDRLARVVDGLGNVTRELAEGGKGL